MSDAILELLAIPALLMTAVSLTKLPCWLKRDRPDAYWGLALCLAIALLPLTQLIPLPPWIWTRLPGRQEIASIFNLLGERQPWMPISVSPHATWLSFLSLLAPMTVFLSVIQLGYRERRDLSIVIIAVGVVSAFLGLMQLAQGPASSLRFFAFTNSTDAVGFFANRNHFAALLYTVLLFAAAWAIDVASRVGSASDLNIFKPSTIATLTSSFLVLIILIAAEVMARSRAGLILMIVALFGIFAMALVDRRNSFATPRKLLTGAVALSFVFAVQFSLYRIQDRYAADPLEDARIAFAHNTIQAASSFLPFGSGMGSFVPVYGMFEKPQDTLINAYANHAHDDFLEVALESGLFGMAILAAFLIWFARRSKQIWLRPTQRAGLDRSLARAATLVIALLLVHSFLDYPLRTAAMTALLAFACGLLVEPLADAAPAAARRQIASDLAGRRLPDSRPPDRRAPVRQAPVAATPPQVVPQRPVLGGKWGEGVDWPDAWRKADGDNRAKDDVAKPEKPEDS